VPSGTEWLVILAVVLLLFGARKLPELARSLGRSTKEFKTGLREGGTEQDSTAEDSTTEKTS
jgi:sec-independent protein translocase protein TatA